MSGEAQAAVEFEVSDIEGMRKEIAVDMENMERFTKTGKTTQDYLITGILRRQDKILKYLAWAVPLVKPPKTTKKKAARRKK